MSLFFLWLQRRAESWKLTPDPRPTDPWQEPLAADMVLDPRLLHRDPESSTAPLLLVSDGCREPGDSSRSQHSSDIRKGKEGGEKEARWFSFDGCGWRTHPFH